jgi:hypothetical protein
MPVARPRRVHTETIAHITLSEDVLTVYFPEKRDDFRDLMHELRFRWNLIWERQMTEISGDRRHRIAEVGRTLLYRGYVVEFPDQETLDMAVAGNYEPECRRWVTTTTSEGRYMGWFLLLWWRDEDCYREAKRITGARYMKPGVVVPGEHYEEVQDFAETNGFLMAPDALSLVQKMADLRAQALIVDLKGSLPVWQPPEMEPIGSISGEIADELADDPL